MFGVLCQAKTYAVLMAGSKGFQNYRHQSDVYRFYNILTSRGMPPEDIIVLSYDDVAESKNNRFHGKVFNNQSHHDIYPGKNRIDYRLDSANAENFIRVLTGDNRNGRALKTTSNDNILIYYCDHGATGFLAVPNGPEIYADYLSAAFNKMYLNKQYKNILFIIEACYSGSVGKEINYPGILTITAAGGIQSSYSADWDNTLGTYLTNEFSRSVINYVVSSDKRVIDLINYACANTNRSHVQALGDFSVSKLPISLFFGTNTHKEQANSVISNSYISNGSPSTSLINVLKYLALRDTTYQPLLDYELNRRSTSENLFNKLNIFNGGYSYTYSVNSYACYRPAVEGFRLFCGEVDEYELPKLSIFSSLCNNYNISSILEYLKHICPKPLWKPEVLYPIK